ncbi:hypothetical protein OG233_21730 [Streptomyces sp. NBC_01218]|uniref:hypothetical protein n=1 Tax=unclassified Streptomyces TaxID=2593676 RepID=UPI0023B8D256|nr:MULTISPECIES: hypothetical protein [unclassified Streptomyces]WEH41942.1 hypothetical protein PZB77_21945 [Streptomyces sp. AM 2-1-1]WSQ53557.1 hypothetical protein OG233_21730 [Streptomyces sp. NBC_01218]
MTAQWYVLIEEDTRTTRQADGVELRLHRWTLVASHPVTGGEAEALAVAEEAALHHVPAVLARHARPDESPARDAYLTSDGSWLVHVRQHQRECHLRVTTARLLHTREEKLAPAKSFREKIRHALDGPEPAAVPWTPGK